MKRSDSYSSFSPIFYNRNFFFALLSLLGACRSAPVIAELDKLPFHVALIPTEIIDSDKPSTRGPIEASYVRADPNANDEDMRLDLTTEIITDELGTQLENAFVRTTLLDLSDEDWDSLSNLKSNRELDRYWVARAREKGADLLLRTKLQVDPKINGERNEKFWLNLPLFLLGGPMCWFVGDRSYEAQAGLEAEFFQVTDVEQTNLDDVSLLPLPLSAKFDGADLRFIDRADGAGDYGLSILIPAGFLAPKTSEVEKEVEGRLPEQLGQQLASEVFAKRQLFENPSLGAFRLDSRAWLYRDNRLIIPVQELPEGKLLRYEISAGNTSVNGTFGKADDNGVHVIDVAFLVPQGISYLTVTLVEENTNRRSYTLKIPDVSTDG